MTDVADLTYDEREEPDLVPPASSPAKFMKHCYCQVNASSLMSKQNTAKCQNRRRSRASRDFLDKINEFRVETRVDRNELISMRLPNAEILGQFQHGRPHGYCEVRYMDGSVFRGNFVDGWKTQGIMTFHNKTVYFGTFSSELFNGQGKLQLPEGRIIEGKWKDGSLIGQARITYKNGDVYFGEVKDLRKHGRGDLYLESGYEYKGQFQNGQITGIGTYSKDGITIYEGSWLNGVLQDQTFSSEYNIGQSIDISSS